jgi:import inner membrane translocase subunit TIM50
MFLSQVGYPNFELVIFTTENGMTFDPIVNGLDPELQHIMYRLYRDATRYVNGHHTKDLSAINRDLKKVFFNFFADGVFKGALTFFITVE